VLRHHLENLRTRSSENPNTILRIHSAPHFKKEPTSLHLRPSPVLVLPPAILRHIPTVLPQRTQQQLSGLVRVHANIQALSGVASNPSAAGLVRPSKSTSEAKKRNICSVCRKPFLRPASLTVHNRTHTEERLFLCPERSCVRSTPVKAFAVKSNWSRHVRNCHPELVGTALVSSVFII